MKLHLVLNNGKDGLFIEDIRSYDAHYVYADDFHKVLADISLSGDTAHIWDALETHSLASISQGEYEDIFQSGIGE